MPYTLNDIVRLDFPGLALLSTALSGYSNDILELMHLWDSELVLLQQNETRSYELEVDPMLAFLNHCCFSKEEVGGENIEVDHVLVLFLKFMLFRPCLGIYVWGTVSTR